MGIIRISKIGFLLAAALLLLCACGKEEAREKPIYTIERYGRSYTVDFNAQTVAYQGVVYSFCRSASGGQDYSVTFTAPDGSTAFWRQSKYTGSGGWSTGWDESVHPGDLADALIQGIGPEQERSGNPVAGLLFIALGAFNALAPNGAWYISYGWRFKDAEPSEMALGLGRAGGVAAILLGLVIGFA